MCLILCLFVTVVISNPSKVMFFDRNQPLVEQTQTQMSANLTCGNQPKLSGFTSSCVLLTHCESVFELTDLAPLPLSGWLLDPHACRHILLGALSFTTLVFMLMGVVCLRK